MARKNDPRRPRACSRSWSQRVKLSDTASFIEPLESRQHLSATLNPSFGTSGQLIGAAHTASTTDTLVPFGNGGVFTFTHGNTITRLLPNGKPDTRFSQDGVIKLTGRNPVESVVALPDGGIYVEYGVTNSAGTATGIGFQHFLKTGRLDTKFGSNNLLNLSNYSRSTTFAAGPMVVSNDYRLYFESNGTTYFIPSNGSVAGIRKTDTHSTGSKIVIRPDGGLFILGSGITAYNRNFQRITNFGNAGIALAGSTINDAAFDSAGRLVVTVGGTTQMIERLTTRGAADPLFNTTGTIALPTSFLSAGSGFTGSHLIVRPDDSVFVSGSVSTTSGTTTSTGAALLAYDSRGRLISKEFSSNSNGVLSSQSGALEGTEVDIAAGPNDTVYVMTLIDRATAKGSGTFDFMEQFALKPFSGVGV